MLRQGVKNQRNQLKAKPVTTQSPETIQWWGKTTLKQDESQLMRLGSLLLRISKGQNEWQLEYHRPTFQDEAEQSWETLAPDAAIPDPAVFERYLFGSTTGNINIEPRLADRPVVIKPLSPILIPAKEKGMLFVSSPLWITAIAETKTEPLFDIPIIRPKDSWFGTETMGEACYASNVFGRTNLSDILPRPFRAVTPIHFTNNSDQQIPLTRLSLPAPSLQLYYSPESGRLWTSTIIVSQDNVHLPVKVKISNNPPKEAGKTIPLGQPRVTDASATLMRMFEF